MTSTSIANTSRMLPTEPSAAGDAWPVQLMHVRHTAVRPLTLLLASPVATPVVLVHRSRHVRLAGCAAHDSGRTPGDVGER